MKQNINTSIQVVNIYSSLGFVNKNFDSCVWATGLLNVAMGETVFFQKSRLFGAVFVLGSHYVKILVYRKDSLVHANDRILRTYQSYSIEVGAPYLGTTITPLNQVLYRTGTGNNSTTYRWADLPVQVNNKRPVEHTSPGIIARWPVCEPLLTGWNIIDAVTSNIYKNLIQSCIIINKWCLDIEFLVLEETMGLLFVKGVRSINSKPLWCRSGSIRPHGGGFPSGIKKQFDHPTMKFPDGKMALFSRNPASSGFISALRASNISFIKCDYLTDQYKLRESYCWYGDEGTLKSIALIIDGTSYSQTWHETSTGKKLIEMLNNSHTELAKGNLIVNMSEEEIMDFGDKSIIACKKDFDLTKAYYYSSKLIQALSTQNILSQTEASWLEISNQYNKNQISPIEAKRLLFKIWQNRPEVNLSDLTDLLSQKSFSSIPQLLQGTNSLNSALTSFDVSSNNDITSNCCLVIILLNQSFFNWLITLNYYSIINYIWWLPKAAILIIVFNFIRAFFNQIFGIQFKLLIRYCLYILSQQQIKFKKLNYWTYLYHCYLEDGASDISEFLFLEGIIEKYIIDYKKQIYYINNPEESMKCFKGLVKPYNLIYRNTLIKKFITILIDLLLILLLIIIIFYFNSYQLLNYLINFQIKLFCKTILTIIFKIFTRPCYWIYILIKKLISTRKLPSQSITTQTILIHLYRNWIRSINNSGGSMDQLDNKLYTKIYNINWFLIKFLKIITFNKIKFPLFSFNKSETFYSECLNKEWDD